MRNEQYDVESAASFTTYEFVSEGRKGKIPKIIRYVEYKDSGLFNLGFGDKIGETEKYDDKIVTNNGDSEKVLATVAATIPKFFDKYPEATIYARGSSLGRTRLYRISISNALEEITKDFDILGSLNGNWEKFQPNRDYYAFLIRKNDKK
jgi:hypothetical protein